DRNARFLIGQSVDPGTRQAVLDQLLTRDDIERVTYLHLEFVGPERLFLVAAIDLAGDAVESTVAHDLRRIERAIEANPHIAQVVLTLSVPSDPALKVNV
ncbi:MAG TPA: cation transporter, partial [Microbacteriaceae bacterium]|nr:cation transporter [Microbacteriaceae bacterium]